MPPFETADLPRADMEQVREHGYVIVEFVL